MTKTISWDKIESDPAYTSLSNEDKGVVKSEWFKEHIGKSSEFKSLEEQDRLTVINNFFGNEISDPEPEGSLWGDIPKSLVRGLDSVGASIGGVMEMAHIPGGTWVKELYETRGARPEIARPKYLQEGTVIDKPERLVDPRWWVNMVGENLPNMATMIAPGVGAYRLTKAAGFGIKAAKKAATVGSVLGGFTVEAGSAYNDAKDEMIEMGYDENTAQSIATVEGLIVGTVNSLLEAAPFHVLLKNKGAKKALARVVRQALWEGGTEAVQENVNMIAAELGHKPDRKWNDWLGRTIESGLAGGVMGFGMGMFEEVRGRIATRKNGAQDVAQPKQQITPQPTIDREKILTGLVNNDITVQDLNALKEGLPQEDISEIDAAIQSFEQGRPNAPEIKTEPIQEVETVKDLFPRQTPEEQADIEREIIAQRAGKLKSGAIPGQEVDKQKQADEVQRIQAKRNLSILAPLWDSLSDQEKTVASELILPKGEKIEEERKIKEKIARATDEERAEAQRKLKEAERLGLKLDETEKSNLEAIAKKPEVKITPEERKPIDYTQLKETGRWEEPDADRIRAKTEKASQEKEMVEGEKERLRLRDTEKDRLETESRKIKERREFYGVRDKVDRGIITVEQARSREWEKKPEILKEGHETKGLPNPADYASELKGSGVDRQESWSRWVQRTTLNPGMGAKEWYKIYDSVTPTVKKEKIEPKKAEKRKPEKPMGEVAEEVSSEKATQIADEFNKKHPGNNLKFDGIQDRSAINKPPLYQFTPQEGPLQGRTFSVENPDSVEAVKGKLDALDDLSQIDTGTPKDDDSSDKEPRKGKKGSGKLAVNEFGEVGGRGEITTGTSVRYKRGKYNVEEIENGRAIISNARGEKIVNLSELSVWSKRLPRQAPTEKRAIGKAWIGNQQRLIIDAYEFKRGRNKGNYRVTLPDGSKKIVAKDAIKLSENVSIVSKRDTFKVSSIDPQTMTASKINKELDSLDRKSSELTNEFIKAGRGREKLQDILRQKDSLSLKYKAISDRQYQLKTEIEARYGPKAPLRLPTRGFGPRKKIPKQIKSITKTLKDEIGSYQSKTSFTRNKTTYNVNSNAINPKQSREFIADAIDDAINRLPNIKSAQRFFNEEIPMRQKEIKGLNKEVKKLKGIRTPDARKKRQELKKAKESLKKDQENIALQTTNLSDPVVEIKVGAAMYRIRNSYYALQVFRRNVLKSRASFNNFRALTNETGSSELANDIYRKAADLIQSGVDNFGRFRREMQKAFKNVWDKIKKHIKALWDIVSNQRGEITIGEKPTDGMTKERREELMKRYAKTPQVKQKEKFDKQLHEDTVDSINEINRVSKTKAIWKFIRPGKLTRQGKKDLSYMWDLMLSVPEFFKQKIGAVERIYQAQQDRMDEYHEHIYQMENQDTVNVVDSLKRLKKQSRKAYRKVKDHLVETDRSGNGFRIGKDNDKWSVYDPKNNIVKEFDSNITEDGTDSGEVQAVEEMIQAEAKNLSEQGFTHEQIESVTAFRLTTNKGFELLFRSMRNLRAKFREAGLPEPTIETWEAGEKQTLTLEQAMAQMGDMRGVYFPRIRSKGRFVLTATKGDDKILRTFNLQNTMSVVKTQLEAQGYKVETGKNRQIGEDVFELSGDLVKTQQILTAAIGKAEKVLSGPFVEGKTELTESVKKLNKDFQRVFEKAVAEQVANVIRGRGSRVHMTKRNPEVWTGYEEDPQIAIAKYIRGLAGGEAKRNASMKMLHALTGTDISWNEFKEQEFLKGRRKVEYEEYIKFVRERMISGKEQPNAFKWAKAYISEMTRNREMADEVIGFVKGIAVGKYLAFRVLSAPLVNITALPTSVVATLKGAGIPYAQSWKYLGKGLSNYGKYIRYMRTNKTDDLVFKTIKEKGWDNPQFSSESIQTLRSQLGRGWDKVIDLGMFTFSESERLNRVATIYAAYHGLKSQSPGLDNESLLEKAKELSDKSHGVYNKGNHPYIALGNNPAAKLSQMFYVFRTFSHTYLLNMRRLGLDKQWGAVAHMALAPAVIAGAGASVMTPIISGLLKMFGFDEPEEELYKYIGENWNPEAEQWARFGLAGAGGIGVSIKGSLAIGIGDLPTRIEDLFGAPGSIGKDIYYGAKSLKRGDVSKGVEKLTPTGFGNLLRAYREYNEGLTTWNNAPKFYGTERLKASKFEAFMRGFSLNPARLAGISEQQWKERKVEEKYRQWRTDIYAKLKRFYLSGGTDEEFAELLGIIENFNERAARWNLSPITPKSIRMNIKRSFKPSKRERMR